MRRQTVKKSNRLEEGVKETVRDGDHLRNGAN